MSERDVSDVDVEEGVCGRAFVFHGAIDEVADPLVRCVECVERVEVVDDGAEDQSWVALNFFRFWMMALMELLTTARVKFGFSFSTKSHAAFS